mmetsp:Transcript_53255/g.105019  ORF Transcript_53255/g.105019 Transcript_53255/m.105019 type:complete len:101 (+) Transcript_53255:1-303(+)
MIAGLLALRSDGSQAARGVNFVHQVFKSADEVTGGTGQISRESVEIAFCTDEVGERISKLQLKVPDWLAIFDVIDINGDGMLTWEELGHGIRAMWDTPDK